MSARDLMDSYRTGFPNRSTSPSRAIVYTRSSDDAAIPLNAFVSGVDFNQDDKDDQKANRISCSGLNLEQEPTKTDAVAYAGKTYYVRSWSEGGSPYTVQADEKRNKVTTRTFKK